ncbi:MAG: serine/threonine-protein kinase [Kofleriaceae bacterium]
MTAVDSAQEELFGPYVVYERLGVGGMATVHRARELGIEGFERIVALKRLLPHLAEDATFIRSFVREAKLASLLHHVNVVQIFELGRVGTQYFISMEHIDGKDLRKILRQARRHAGPPPIGVTLGLLLQLCDALDYAHTMIGEDGTPLHLVHRDVSPSNILLNKAGYLKVIDFGIAKAQSSQLKTQTGRVKGKLAYMAPEAVSGRELDARSDLFAAGVIAHELLTARPLFACKNEYQTLLRVQRGDILAPSTYNHSCPPELDAIVLRALSRDPNERFDSAAAFRDELLDLRAKYQLAATHREIGSWIDWAFSVAEASTEYSLPHDRIETRSPVPQRSRTSERSIASALPPPPAPQPITPEEDELVDVAWGNQAVESGAPLVLDDIPDVSDKLAMVVPPDSGELPPVTPPHHTNSGHRPIVAHAAADASGRLPVAADAPPVIGGAFAARANPKSRVPLVAVAVGGIAVALAAWLVMRDSGKNETSAAATAVVPQPIERYVKFTTEPVDTRILIDGSVGHIGTPWKVALGEGEHEVEISREGYKTWTRSVSLEVGETQAMHVVLEQLDKVDRNLSTLRVRPRPGRFDAEVDGNIVPSGTPFDMQVAPGLHSIVLRKNGVAVLRREFEVKAASVYEISHVIADKRRDEPERVVTARAPAPVDAAVPVVDAPPPAPAVAAGSAAGSGSAGSGSAASSGSASGSGSSIASLAPPVPQPAPALPKPIVAPLPAAPIAAPAPAAPQGPVGIAPSKVSRISGDPPNLRQFRLDDDVPKVIGTKICIGANGEVTSVNITTQLDNRYAREIRNALKRWKYSPYLLNGKPHSACFHQNLKTR